MKKLSDYASNMYSQYGEDGMIEEILNRMEIGPGKCVEFGASDGLACSNTAKLWRHEGWRATLMESNQSYNAPLHKNVSGYECNIFMTEVTASNINSLLDPDPYDLISIDVDGDDFWIFCSMERRTKILIIEYNRTIPPHIDLVPEQGSPGRMGIGSYTLRQAAETRGYTLIGMSEANAFFVATEYAHLFDDLEKDLNVLQPPEQFIYLATDGDGHIVPLGHNPPWGLIWPPSLAKFRPNQDELLAVTVDDERERIRTGYDAMVDVAWQVRELRSLAMYIINPQGDWVKGD